MEYDVTEVTSLHICSVLERCDSIIKNVLLLPSASVNAFNPDDDNRIKSYNKELREYVAWVNTQPLLDLPHCHPQEWVLDLVATETSRHIQNRSMRDLARLYASIMKELGESDSARMGSGIVAHDLIRFTKIMDQVDNLMKFMRDNQPLDKPESMPHAPIGVQGSQNSTPTHS